MLALRCAAAGIKLVHFSTDYVFGLDATRTTPLHGRRPARPGQCLWAEQAGGEYRGASREPGKPRDPHLWALRLAGQRRERRQLRRDDAAAGGRREADSRGERPALHAQLHRRCGGGCGRPDPSAGLAGLFHVTNAGSCTWYEFAAEIFRAAGLKPSLNPITSAEYRKCRPPAAFQRAVERETRRGRRFPPRPWPEALAAYLVERAGKPV